MNEDQWITHSSGGEGGQGEGDSYQDRFFEQIPPNAGPVTWLVGLLRPGDREGYSTLYLTLDMSRHLEIANEDIVFREALDPATSPFGSLGGTRIAVRRGAQLTHNQTSSQSVTAGDFDLDVQLAPPGGQGPALLPQVTFNTCGDECEQIPIRRTLIDTCFNTCYETCFNTCYGTCRRTICGGATCYITCRTCDQATCYGTCGQTCDTCNTCATQCGTCNTCVTCRTRCGEDTCLTCIQTRCRFTCNVGCV